MSKYFDVTLIFQVCIKEKFDISLDEVDFDKVLSKPFPDGYEFNKNSLRSFVNEEMTPRINVAYPKKIIKFDDADSKALVDKTSIPLITFIGDQL